MPVENPFYNALVAQINYGTTPRQRALSEEALGQIFRPLIEGALPPPNSRRGVTPETYLEFWDTALTSLNVVVGVERMSGQTDNALDLSQVRVNAATNHARRLTSLVAGSDIDRRGTQPGRFQLKAAYHHVSAVAELINLAGGDNPRILQPDGGALLHESIWILRHNPRAVDIFGPNQLREIFDITAGLPKAQYVTR